MFIINKEEEKAYSLFADKIAYTSYVESSKAIKDFNTADFNVIAKASQEIGGAVGQVVLDRVIELTKDMDRDMLIRYLAQSTFAHTIETMNSHPEYRAKIIMVGPFLDRL